MFSIAQATDVLAKLGVASGVLAAVSLVIFPADVGLVVELDVVDGSYAMPQPSRCVTEHATTDTIPSRIELPKGSSFSCNQNPFYQSFIDRNALTAIYHEMGHAVPEGVDLVVQEYNQQNQQDLRRMRDSTSEEMPLALVCARWPTTTKLLFGRSLCNRDRASASADPFARYRGRLYERMLVAAQAHGIKGVAAMSLEEAELTAALDAMHSAERSVARVVVENTGRSPATEVVIHPSAGYLPLAVESPLTIQPGQRIVRTFRTADSSTPDRRDRRFDVSYSTSRGFIPGGRLTVILIGILICFIALLAGFQHPGERGDSRDGGHGQPDRGRPAGGP